MRADVKAVLSVLMILGVTACTEATPVGLNEDSAAESPQGGIEFEAQVQNRPMQSSVHWLSDLSTVAGAWASLNRTNSGASYTFHTNGLTKGHVVTMWWVIFNHPDECENPVPAIGSDCNVPDLFNPDVEASVVGGQGHIVGASGRSTHAGHLREGEITNYHPAFVGSPGLIDAMEAEIHLVLRTHGPMIPGMIAEMRSTFEAACTPESSVGFGSGPNECADLQAAAFSAP